MRFNYFLIFFVLTNVLLMSYCSNPEREKYEAYIKEGEVLAKTHCTTCHKESPPELLSKKTWAFDVLPQMGPRMGMHKFKTLHYERIHPLAMSYTPMMEQEQWDNIVDYFFYSSPDSLPKQSFEKEPSLDCETFEAKPFTNDISSSSIITMMKMDTARKNLFVADINNNTLFKFNYSGELIDTLQLPSPQPR